MGTTYVGGKCASQTVDQPYIDTFGGVATLSSPAAVGVIVTGGGQLQPPDKVSERQFGNHFLVSLILYTLYQCIVQTQTKVDKQELFFTDTCQKICMHG